VPEKRGPPIIGVSHQRYETVILFLSNLKTCYNEEYLSSRVSLNCTVPWVIMTSVLQSNLCTVAPSMVLIPAQSDLICKSFLSPD
jgi:hypothetical protein